MFAVIRRYEGIVAGAVPQIMESVNRDLLPILGELPGFVAYYAVEEGNGVIASIMIFRDRASADEGQRVFADPARPSAARGLLTTPQVTRGEVLVHASGGTTAS